MRKTISIKRVSILLSCWSADELVDGYIDALLSNGIVENCKLIAVDFPHTHKDPGRVRTVLHKYPDIEYIESTNSMSLYEAWNLAAKSADSEFLANLNLDDRVAEDYYIEGISALNETGADVFSSMSCMTSTVGDWDGALFIQQHLPDDLMHGKRIVTYGLSDFVFEIDGQPKKRNPPHCAPIWRRRLHEHYGWFDCRRFDFCADFEFWLRCAAAGRKFIILNEAKTLFYCASGTASDRIMHSENKSIVNKWSRTFPPIGYKESHLGRRHDNLHYCMNLNAIFSNRSYYWGLSGMVSVIVIGHDAPTFFQECLDSIASQDYCLIDCIIVLDNAEMEVCQIADTFASSDARFRVVTLGQRCERNYARNVGLTLAIGKWVCFVDGDDLLAAGSISSRVSTAARIPTSIVFGGLEIFNAEGVIQVVQGQEKFDFYSLRLGWPHHCSLLIPSDLLRLNGIQYPARAGDILSDSSQIAGEDVDFMTKLLHKNTDLVFVNCGAPAYRYRRHSSSSYTQRHVSIGSVIAVLLRVFGTPSERDDVYCTSLARRLLGYVFWCHVNKSAPEANCVDFLQLSRELRLWVTPCLLAESIVSFRQEVYSLRDYKIDATKADAVNLELAAIGAGLFLPTDPVESHATREIGTSFSPKRLDQCDHYSNNKGDYDRLLRLKNRDLGGDCIIVGDGLGVGCVDFERIDRERFKIILAVEAGDLFRDDSLEADYSIYFDGRHGPYRTPADRKVKSVELISNRFDLSKFPSNPTLFHINTEYNTFLKAGFSLDIADYVGGGGYGVPSALQIAYYMGFHRVYILGAGGGGVASEALGIRDGAGQSGDWPQSKDINNFYREARLVYERAGREVYDCTINGSLNIFSRQHLSEIYRSAGTAPQ